MTPEEHERLTRVETFQTEMRDDIAEIKHDVKDLRNFQARAGGVMFAVGCMAAAVTWVLSNLKSFLGITTP